MTAKQIRNSLTDDNNRLSFDLLQKVWREWSTKNFGPSFQPVHGMPYRPLLGIFEEIGEFQHALYELIIGSSNGFTESLGGRKVEDEARDAVGDTIMFIVDYCNGRNWLIGDILELDKLKQHEVIIPWSVGLTIWSGRLAHCHLKQEQGIRVNENHEENAKICIGMLIRHLMAWCDGKNGGEFEAIVLKTAEEVLQRDWQTNKATGAVRVATDQGEDLPRPAQFI